jgi:hypothetical protein
MGTRRSARDNLIAGLPCNDAGCATIWNLLRRRSGLPGGTRTPDLLLRRQLLYPVELRAAFLALSSGGQDRTSVNHGQRDRTANRIRSGKLPEPRQRASFTRTARKRDPSQAGRRLPGPSLICMRLVVGAIGFEPTTLWSQTRCATRLRYAPPSRILRGCTRRPFIQPARTSVHLHQGALLAHGKLRIRSNC